MKNIRIWYLIVILLPLAQSVYSQRNSYIETDSMMTSGINLVNGSPHQNAQFIVEKRKTGENRYFPDRLKGYGFSGGPEYISKSIIVNGQSKRVFLERIRKGRINLYYYTEKGFTTYFLEKDSTVFVEIPDRYDFRVPIFENTSDFSWKANQVQMARYKRNSLEKLISIYNKGINRPLPYPRFGVTAGYSVMYLTVPDDLNVGQTDFLSFTPGPSAQAGIFADLPVMMSDFSVNVGVNLSQHGFSANSVTAGSDVDVVVNLTSARLPVLLRYTVPALTWRPFINAGAIGSWYLKCKREIYESTFLENSIIINEVESSTVSSRVSIGYSVGAGLQYNLTPGNATSLEVRYSQFPGINRGSDMSFAELFVSYSF